MLLIALAIPTAAAGQSAGDEQYSDPFGGQDQPQQQPEQPAPSQQPADPQAVPEEPSQQSTSTQTAESGGSVGAQDVQANAPTLPVSGMPALIMLVAGAGLLAAGAATRRRL
jgi:hypothetical protein